MRSSPPEISISLGNGFRRGFRLIKTAGTTFYDKVLKDEFRHIGNFLFGKHFAPCRHFSTWTSFSNRFEDRRSIKRDACILVLEAAYLGIDEISSRPLCVAILAMASRTICHIELLTKLCIANQAFGQWRTHFDFLARC